MKSIFFEGKDKEQYQLSLTSTDANIIDMILDQLNIGEVKFIEERDFNIDTPMTIDVIHPDSKVKIGELTCKDIMG